MGIIKYTASDVQALKIKHAGENSIIYDDGVVLIKHPTYESQPIEDRSELMHLSAEKVFYSDKHSEFDEDIAIPLDMVLVDGKYFGYTMRPRKGKTFSEYFLKGQITVDLYAIADIFEQKENIVKKANKSGIIIPDLATEENILIDESGKVVLLQYDGFQIEDMPSFVMSTNIVSAFEYCAQQKKYARLTGDSLLWTANLDKMSLITQFLFACTKINLPDQPFIQHSIGRALDLIGLDDPEIREKVKLLYSDSKENVYFGDSYRKIADTYDVVPGPVTINATTKCIDRMRRFKRK